MINHLPETLSSVNQEQRQERRVTSHLEQKARQAAQSHQLGSESGLERDFLDRPAQQEQQLRAAYQHFRQSSRDELTLSYAAEWLLDNFYIVQQALRQIEEDLPPGYYRRLPKLNSGSSLAGFPRVYALARELVLHEQAQLDLARVEQFVKTYQTVAPLTMGEIWALPSMLRFAILESLAQATGRLTGLADAATPPGPAFQLNYELTDADLVAHCIPSLRLLATQDWKLFFENVSLVEQILQRDPAGIYTGMDFDTRNRYRTAIEQLARATCHAEIDIAHSAVELAAAHLPPDTPQTSLKNDNHQQPGPFTPPLPDLTTGLLDNSEMWQGLDLPRTAHIGFYLIDEGLAQLEAHFNYHPAGMERLRRTVLSRPTFFYLGSIGFFSLLVLVAMVSYALASGGTFLQIAAAGLATLIPAVTIATFLVNWLVTHTLPPRILPKLDFTKGIPVQCRTMVVIPTLLTHPDEVESLLSQLELHYLRNPDPYLTFALLTDFADASQESLPEDEALLAQAKRGIEALNQRYDHRPFYLFHRRRLWNPSEAVWMGWERKRGKLHEFNRLLRGDRKTSYMLQVGNLSVLSAVHYVITLDADTILPRDSAFRLISTLAHPLNRAQFDAVAHQVTAGYTILQPRTEIKPTSTNQSLFTQVFAGDTGLDLYTLAVSDVYQDLFGEGIYVGKGIYDVDAFEASLRERVPENALLSHDLFEGIYGRAGLVTDIILYEDYPPHYLVHISRSYRWIRGDWQLLPWLWPRVPRAGGGTIPSPLSVIDRWKIVDNLRRSLLSLALLLLFLAGWLLLPGSPVVWTLLGLFTPAWPFITDLIASSVRLIGGMSGREFGRTVRNSALRWLLAIAFLPYESILALDAIVITLVRLFVAHRRMLQWTTAADTVRLFGSGMTSDAVWRQMIPAGIVFSIMLVAIILVNPHALLVAAPLLLAWLLSPEIAYWISRSRVAAPSPLTAEQRQQLRILARRTWLFFEQFVGPQDNWLPPDHFQESPRGVIAHRTSPTNVGMYLLSTIAAYDLGYLHVLELALRLRATFDTMKQLERYRGHFLNWIDTQTLHPLPPRYVSTVDSGNLAACLLTLKQSCLDIIHHPLWHWLRWQGFLNTLDLLSAVVTELQADGPETSAGAIQAQIAAISQQVLTRRDKPSEWTPLLSHLLTEALPRLDQLLVAWVEDETSRLDTARLGDLRLYAERLHHFAESMERQLDLLPWLLPLTRPPTLFSQPDLDPALTTAWQALIETWPAAAPALSEASAIYQEGQARLAQLQELLPGETESTQAAHAWCQELAARLRTAEVTAKALLTEYQQLNIEAETFLQEMDFGFLFNPQRQVFHIGYNLEAGRLDENYYDLLSSEARIASLVAIAKNEVPQSHWLHLGRPLRYLAEGQTLLSWSGTMFEYLMPSLLMQTYEGTLLHQSLHTVVDYQIAYGRQNNIPWGISESGYYAFDSNLNYQYRAFGAPALGFKRGLADDQVVSPYASLLALSVRPQKVLENIAHLTRLKMIGRYGFYEALDFTPTRLPLRQEKAIVASYMSHHQGMIMLSLANYLQNGMMIRRFHTEPSIQSVELLLQEHIPKEAPDEKLTEEDIAVPRSSPTAEPIAPWETPVDTPLPQVHYLSNGHYHVLLTNVGGGYSCWQDICLTRWRADTTLDNWGSWLYLQDEDSGALWSATYQPTTTPPESQRVIFHPHKAEFHRRDNEVALSLEVAVAPDDDVEIRIVTLTNESSRPRRLRLTSYGEVSLVPPATDERHPAFAKLFVQSQYLPEHNALLFRRRPRSAEEENVFLVHLLTVEPGQPLTRAYESSRAYFLGRGHTPAAPAALTLETGLSGTVGATLDPIFSLGQTVELEPHASVKLAILTLAAPTHRAALNLAERYQRWPVIDRAFSRARTQSEYELRQLGFDTDLFKHTQQMLGLLLYPHRAGRARPDTLATNQNGQPGLWAFGISGDYPILLVRLQTEEELPLAHELLQAHTYWRHRHLQVDLVFLNQQETGYGQALQNDLFRIIQRSGKDNQLNQRGGIFLLRSGQMTAADLTLLQTAARVMLDADRGSLATQLAGLYEYATHLPEHVPAPAADAEPTSTLPRPDNLQFDNGWGGFSPDGCEYVIYLRPGEATPAPWINVIANETFGCLVSETGGGYTWAVNSGENRLSPWRNDPITDLPGEALYLRDEETAEIWSPTPQPAPAPAPYLVRHGAGYTIFTHHSHGLRQRLRLFAVPDAPLKVVQLRLENEWSRPRRITATYYLEWVLGVNRETSQQYIITEYDEESRALLARNPYNVEFGQRIAFVTTSKAPHGLTADRTEFLGRMGSLREPAGLRRIGLESRVEAGLDPCAALQLHMDLAPGGSEEIYFLIGQGADRDETRALIQRYHDPAQIDVAWQAVQTMWADILGAVQVDTPDPAMNLLLNRWLLYQTLACRLWGRTALYQSSGAYGSRDQLQDVMALLHTRPDLAREHILRAARHQFTAGDVLHWWHPPSGRGVRTLIRDDLLWLPYVSAHYVAVTGDETILQEEIPFLKGEPLKQDEEERYGYYDWTQETYSLFEHCRRALQKGDTSGRYGLPLMGSSDWNDGMNRVGNKGRGESVWLGWFLYAALTTFADLCERMGDTDPAGVYRRRAGELSHALEATAWDGAWYRRAYYDDGTPLGSAQNLECQIDAIAQSWAVLSRAADTERASQAMAAVMERLVKWDERLILLFTPPFDKTSRDPGYIKGYLPGIRENGGQYTHAAMWTIWATAQLGDGDQAEALFRLINPIYRADTPEKAVRYQVEPYVISADVYSIPPHTGRGGWTWYTGSSGWMYRLGLEAILGVRREGTTLQIHPCLPRNWPGYTMTYRFGKTIYQIKVENPAQNNQPEQRVFLDGHLQPDGKIPLQDDNGHHQVEIKWV